MTKIRVETERLKAIAAQLEEYNTTLYVIRCRIAASTYYVDHGTKNWSANNVVEKMNALTSKMTDLSDKFEGYIGKLNEAAYQSEEISSTLTSQLPEWAKTTFDESFRKTDWWEYYITRDGDINNIATWNNAEGEVLSCTYYTLRRLRDRGLGYPFIDASEGSANGGNWFNNCDDCVKKSKGENCLEAMFNDFGAGEHLQLNNVVVSFDGGKWGHVVLIDRVYIDPDTKNLMVEWSDMYGKYPFPIINGDRNKSNPTATMTVEEFYNFYKADENDKNAVNFTPNGAVLIGEVSYSSVEIDLNDLSQYPGETNN